MRYASFTRMQDDSETEDGSSDGEQSEHEYSEHKPVSDEVRCEQGGSVSRSSGSSSNSESSSSESEHSDTERENISFGDPEGVPANNENHSMSLSPSSHSDEEVEESTKISEERRNFINRISSDSENELDANSPVFRRKSATQDEDNHPSDLNASYGDSDQEGVDGVTKSDIVQLSRHRNDHHGDNNSYSDVDTLPDDTEERVPGDQQQHEEEGEGEAGPDVEESDFDRMRARQRLYRTGNTRRHRASNIDLINDNDDMIVDLIRSMRAAAEEDRELNRSRQPATRKLSMLRLVVSQLNKRDLQLAFVESNILSVMTEWLAPLPDRSLPAFNIREKFLNLLQTFPLCDQQALKSSGIGKAVMYLYRHPREEESNKRLAGRLISQWSRPIFNLSTNYKELSKEERQRRDMEHTVSAKRVRKSPHGDSVEKVLRPGDVGWVSRARVPQFSDKDYVNRPAWNNDTPMSNPKRKTLTRYEKHQRTFMQARRRDKMQQAVKISIEGRKMAL